MLFLVYYILFGKYDFETNSSGSQLSKDYIMMPGRIAEMVLIAFFLWVILGSAFSVASKGFAGIANGLATKHYLK